MVFYIICEQLQVLVIGISGMIGLVLGIVIGATLHKGPFTNDK